MKHFSFFALLTAVIISAVIGAVAGIMSVNYGLVKNSAQTAPSPNIQADAKSNLTGNESDVIKVADSASPSVVSIIVSKDLPKIEQFYSDPGGMQEFFDQFFGGQGPDMRIPQYRQNGTEKREIGGGTGFIVTDDGYIVTNKHVVFDDQAEYTVLMNDEKKYEAKVLAKDSVNDIAILKIDAKGLKFLTLGESAKLKVGQSVIAIGNALGEFRNTVSTGVVSGLSRSITAGSYGRGAEKLVGLIQTDASINPGNSGGPLLDLAGRVIGVNVAMAQGAQNIGFAIPVDQIKSAIDSVKKNGKIVRPWLGVRYIMINEEIAKANKLEIKEGALVIRGEKPTDLAVIPGSPADKAGITENDIITEVNGQKIKADNDLVTIINKSKPGDEVKLKVMHKGEFKDIKVKLVESK